MSRVVAISGANGFIGANLRRALEHRGDTVVPLPRHGADLGSPAIPPDVVVHLAFPTSAADRRADPLSALRTAVGTTLSALEIAAASGAAHFLLASSGKVYASPPSLPIRERHPVGPATRLGELKLTCEQIVGLSVRRGTDRPGNNLHDAAQRDNAARDNAARDNAARDNAARDLAPGAAFGVSVLRIFNVYGPGQRTEFVVPHLLSGLDAGRIDVGETGHARDYIHVDDVCRAFITAMEHPPGRGELRTMNVASGRAASVAELAAMIETETGRRLELVVDPARCRPGECVEERGRCDALADLGFRAGIALEQGIAALVRHAET